MMDQLMIFVCGAAVGLALGAGLMLWVIAGEEGDE